MYTVVCFFLWLYYHLLCIHELCLPRLCWNASFAFGGNLLYNATNAIVTQNSQHIALLHTVEIFHTSKSSDELLTYLVWDMRCGKNTLYRFCLSCNSSDDMDRFIADVQFVLTWYQWCAWLTSHPLEKLCPLIYPHSPHGLVIWDRTPFSCAIQMPESTITTTHHCPCSRIIIHTISAPK